MCVDDIYTYSWSSSLNQLLWVERLCLVFDFGFSSSFSWLVCISKLSGRALPAPPHFASDLCISGDWTCLLKTYLCSYFWKIIHKWCSLVKAAEIHHILLIKITNSDVRPVLWCRMSAKLTRRLLGCTRQLHSVERPGKKRQLSSQENKRKSHYIYNHYNLFNYFWVSGKVGLCKNSCNS